MNCSGAAASGSLARGIGKEKSPLIIEKLCLGRNPNSTGLPAG
jgi:hypothetical protein